MKGIFFVLTNSLRCFDETDVRTSQKTTYAQYKIYRTNFIDEIGPRLHMLKYKNEPITGKLFSFSKFLLQWLIKGVF